MNAPSTVLIIDRSAESRDVLKTLLERRGTRAFEAEAAWEAKAAAEKNRPDLIVVDIDDELQQNESVDGCLDAASRTDTPILVIGSERRRRSQLPEGHFLAKPYHYRDLLRRIDALLA